MVPRRSAAALGAWVISGVTDGVAVWNDSRWLAREDSTEQFDGADHARQFVQKQYRCLGLGDEVIKGLFEDVYYYLWKEGTLPVNVDLLG